MIGLTKMQKLVLLLTFFLSEEAVEGDSWDKFVDYKIPFDEDGFFMVVSRIVNNIDEKYVDWSMLEKFAHMAGFEEVPNEEGTEEQEQEQKEMPF